MNVLRLMGRELRDLFYPDVCVTCRRPLVRGENTLCSYCLNDLPLTGSETEQDNAVSRLFWGLVPIAHAAALFYYRKGSRYHVLLHRLKYRGDTEIGVRMGYYLGTRLLQTPFAGADALMPVPLHPQKLRQRGYNQSRVIADGLSRALLLPVVDGVLMRTGEAVTQTHSGRRERFEHVSDHFVLTDEAPLRNRHIILVDDVVTTGATISACAEALCKIPGITVSVAALAVAAE
ncbi:MAG: ComF family protein [Bacteroidales bacterium]|nr:ComF family protein [Bacteroidales bacterium]MBQ7212934.1 ComF family protein [Bacteroidales bacterium]